MKAFNPFKVASIATAVLYFYLFVMLLTGPESFAASLGLTGGAAFDFLARRASVLMLAFGVLLFSARNAPPSSTRQAIALSVGVNMIAFAISGSVEFARGVVQSSVLTPAVIEVLTSAVWFGLYLSTRRTLKSRQPAAA